MSPPTLGAAYRAMRDTLDDIATPGVPVWQTVLAFILPVALFRGYRWFRKARGGLWTMAYSRDNSPYAWTVRWEQHLHCPAKGPPGIYTRGEYTEWACTRGDATHPAVCHCEAWEP